MPGTQLSSSGDVMQIRLQGDTYPTSGPGDGMCFSTTDMFGTSTGEGPYYIDSAVGVGGSIGNYGAAAAAGIMMMQEDELISSSGLDSGELVQLLGGSQAISQLPDAQLEELGRMQFTIVDQRANNELGEYLRGD